MTTQHLKQTNALLKWKLSLEVQQQPSEGEGLVKCGRGLLNVGGA